MNPGARVGAKCGCAGELYVAFAVRLVQLGLAHAIGEWEGEVADGFPKDRIIRTLSEGICWRMILDILKYSKARNNKSVRFHYPDVASNG